MINQLRVNLTRKSLITVLCLLSVLVTGCFPEVSYDFVPIPAGASGNVTATSGTATYIPKFSTSTNLVNSTVSENTTSVNIANNLTITENITMIAGKTVDGVDVSGHASRHQWGGADTPSINWLALTIPQYLTQIQGSTPLNSFSSGTGSYINYYPSSFKVMSGATSGSTAGISALTGIYYGQYALSQYYSWYLQIIPATDTDQCEMWWVLTDGWGILPTTLSNHIGMKSVSTSNGVPGVLSFTCSAGAAETTIQLDASFVQYEQYWIILVLYSSPDDSTNYRVDCWYATTVNGPWSLLGTASTNIPAPISLNTCIAVKNYEATDKEARVLSEKLTNSSVK